MLLYVEDIIREVDLLNWYRGEASKRMDENADLVQSSREQQDVVMDLMRGVVTDVLLLANHNRVRFSCDYVDDMLKFDLSPIREERRYLLRVLKEALRRYIVYEIRRLWMTLMRPEWAETSMRESLRQDIRDVLNACTTMGERVRRRATTMGI